MPKKKRKNLKNKRSQKKQASSAKAKESTKSGSLGSSGPFQIHVDHSSLEESSSKIEQKLSKDSSKILESSKVEESQDQNIEQTSLKDRLLKKRSLRSNKMISKDNTFIYYIIIVLLVFAVVATNIFYMGKFRALNSEYEYAQEKIKNTTSELDYIISLLNSSESDVNVYDQIYDANKERLDYLELQKNFKYIKDQGIVATYCIPSVSNVPTANEITVSAKATYGNGWPRLFVKSKLELVHDFVVNTTDFSNYTIPVNVEKGVTHIEFVIVEDFNDVVIEDGEEVKKDRNVWIENFYVGSKKINWFQGVVDVGNEKFAFDCEDTKESSGIYSTGAMRFALAVK